MSASILAFAASTIAGPIGETSPNIYARDNSKLNQYNHPEWYFPLHPPLSRLIPFHPSSFPIFTLLVPNGPSSKDDNGSNVPTYHAAPPMYKCYNIDSTTESFFWNLGPLTYLWAYKNADCQTSNSGGFDFDLALEHYDQSGCQPINVQFETIDGPWARIGSIMMH
ncbi:hypothetical protein LTR56_012862 [Elasticomyces elasticus]|nr:hypothetical protein LTR56_012862 [Elasticomyces elasticus]KAK3650788.1 hypothetical protein LTR22_012387 [Elasticomyces elasticus]KAK4918492.1 hypothetical protein LTR49_013725 [Elasticomyces elasticus]KAK5757870.1 hypothetical protein LTS12_012054 [Elasticomyces elasticus]